MSSISDLIKVAYKVLFCLQVELEGYSDDVNPFIKIVPDESTAELFTKYNMLLRKAHGATVMLIETDTDSASAGKPVVMLQNDERFTFQVKMDRQFLAATHLASYNFTDHVLYGANDANHVVATHVLLSVPFAVYNNSHAYESGHLVRSSGRFYRALQASNSSSPHGVTQAAYWKEIGSAAYVSQADLRTRSSIARPLDVDTVMVIEIVHNNALAPKYRLLSNASVCKEVIYKIRLHT